MIGRPTEGGRGREAAPRERRGPSERGWRGTPKPGSKGELGREWGRGEREGTDRRQNRHHWRIMNARVNSDSSSLPEVKLALSGFCSPEGNWFRSADSHTFSFSLGFGTWWGPGIMLHVCKMAHRSASFGHCYYKTAQVDKYAKLCFMITTPLICVSYVALKHFILWSWLIFLYPPQCRVVYPLLNVSFMI